MDGLIKMPKMTALLLFVFKTASRSDAGRSSTGDVRRPVTSICERTSNSGERRSSTSVNRLVGAAKEALARTGAACSPSTLLKLNSVFNYLWVGHWMQSRGFQVPQRVDSREQVFGIAAQEIRDSDVLYLEFGVYRGESIRFWSSLLRNPQSKLQGFDSFEGLPESWDLSAEKGHFTMEGAIPVIDDPRVSFVKGWYNETLPHCVLPDHERLFVNFDADLYSSTKTVLDFLKPNIRVGTYLYFDEFQAREHESKAFDEFLSETGWTFRVVAASRGLANVLFQRTRA
jgi:hypothetical protein